MKQGLHTLDQILALPDGGEFLISILDQHAELIKAMTEKVEQSQNAASGSIAIKVSYKIDRMGTLEMKAQCDTTLPKDPPAKAIAWTTEDGTITPANPNQMHLPLRDAGAGASAEVRSV